MADNIYNERIKFLAHRQMDIAEDQDYVSWAIMELMTGNESDSINILAGLLPPFNHFEVDIYVKKSLKEMAIPENTDFLDLYVEILARRRLANEITSLEITEEMYNIFVYSSFNSKYSQWSIINEYYDDYYLVSDRNIEDVIVEECKRIIDHSI